MKPQHTKSHYEKKFSEELSRLNPEQRRAVEKIEGPVMVIAGPGTGKTQIIAARIGQILKSDVLAGPHNILCLTYTDAGAVAMRNRLAQFIGPTAFRVNIYTFHAFCNEIIQHNQDYFGTRELEPVSDLETVHLFRKLVDELPANHLLKKLKGDAYFYLPHLRHLFTVMKQENWKPDFVSQKIDAYLSDLPNRDEYRYKKGNKKSGIAPGDIKQNEIDKQKQRIELTRAGALLFPKYQEMMKERGVYDFSDMLLWVLSAFENDVNFLRNYQEWFQYFLVDEYQDTNGAQNKLLQLLIDYWDKPNVFVVGDDDQCIYEFQGARVKNITRLFEKYQQEMEVIALKKNYRSTQIILDAARAVIDNNTQRLINQESLLQKIPALSKTLEAAEPVFKDSTVQPRIIQYGNIQEEEAAVAEQIAELFNSNFPLDEVAVIYRQHKQAGKIIELLEKKKIPYCTRREINVLEVPLIGQILNILFYLNDELRHPYSGEHRLFEIMHYCFFEIDPREIALLAFQCKKKREPLRKFIAGYKQLEPLNLKSYNKIIFFEENITRWMQDIYHLTLPVLLEKILNFGNILKYILNSGEKIFLLQVVNTFFDFLKNECAKKPLLTLDGFLQGIILPMRESSIAIPLTKIISQDSGVTLTTAHSAKGLEFRTVFLTGCTRDCWENISGRNTNFYLPDTVTFSAAEDAHKDINKTESARRLFYVAMTRAKERLHISYPAKKENSAPLVRSQFVEEILQATSLCIEEKHLSEEKMAEYLALALQSPPQPQIEILDKNYIDEALANYSLSPTHLNKYLECPVAFYYEHILKVPSAKIEAFSFGTAMHETLRWIFKEQQRTKNFPLIEAVIQQYEKCLHAEMENFTPAEFERRLLLGKQLLPDYCNKYQSSWRTDVRVEFPIRNIEMNGVPLNGKIDKIEILPGGDVNVVDYKTGEPDKGLSELSPPSERFVHGGKNWRQLVFYKILLDNFRKEKFNTISGEIDFLEKHKKENDFVKQKIVFSAEDVAFVKNLIKEVYAKIMNHEFSQGCGEKDCRWCGFVRSNQNEPLGNTAKIYFSVDN